MAPNMLHQFFAKQKMMNEDKPEVSEKKREEVKEQTDHEQLRGVGAAILYGSCSVAIAFINKLLLTTYEFDYPVLIMILQMIYTLVLLNVLNAFSLISLPTVTFQRIKDFALPAICYAANSVLALSALSHMNVAMYGVLKRCVPIVTLLMSVFVMKKSCPSKKSILAIVLLTCGCIVASYGDLKFNLMAYTCGAMSNVLQALYLLLVQLCCEKKMSTVETLQLNSINTLPFLIISALFKQEFSQVMRYPSFHSASFYILLVTVLNMGCLLNYSLFLCTSCTSAVTTSVVGGMKALVQTILGLFTFGGVSPNAATFMGIFMNFSGGILYIYAKLMDNKEKIKGHIRKIVSLSSSEQFKALEDGSKGKLNKIRPDSQPPV